MSDILSYRFMYDGASRIVDNIAFEKDCLIGFEARRSGRFSNKVKRFSLAGVSQMKRIDPVTRKGKNVRP